MEEGGYRSVTLREQTVTLTNAQMLLLHSTEVVAVDASEGTVIIPISAQFVLDASGGAYANGASKVLGLRYAGNSVFITGTAALDVAAALASAHKSFGQFNIPAAAGVPYLDIDTADLINIDVVVRFVSGTALTGGNSANTMKVITQYVEITI